VPAVTDFLTLQKALSQNERAVCMSFDISVVYCKYTTFYIIYLTNSRLTIAETLPFS